MKLLLRAYVHPNWHVSAQLKQKIYSLDVNIKSVSWVMHSASMVKKYYILVYTPTNKNNCGVLTGF